MADDAKTVRERIDRLKTATCMWEIRDERDVVISALIVIVDALERELERVASLLPSEGRE